MVTVVGIEVTGNNVLEVAVLPVQVTGLNGPCEHSPVGAHLCTRSRRRSEEDLMLNHVVRKSQVRPTRMVIWQLVYLNSPSILIFTHSILIFGH